MDIPTLIATGSAIVSLFSAGFILYKWQTGERPKLGADIAAELIGPYREEVEKLRNEVAQMKEENEILRKKLYRLEDVEDWAERLVFQIRSLPGNIEPVKIRVRNSPVQAQGKP